MSSYYNRVDGNLRPNQTARVSDINAIQTNVQHAIKMLTTDILGTNFILGEEEEALQVIPTTDVIDQTNYNYDESPNRCWISFYDRYLRQTIHITKSSIESVTVHMKNMTNVTTTIYAEIRDSNFKIEGESSVILPPTDMTKPEGEQYDVVTFNFNIDHLPVGDYYFVLRPVDISATDLAINGDETSYDTIGVNDFLVRYDIDGTYHKDLNDIPEEYDEEDVDISGDTTGLEASYDGTNYLSAVLLEEQLLTNEEIKELDPIDPNFDLYFEESYSSGLTFLVNPGEAIVLGEKVDSFDTHVKINAPSTEGDRTDLVILRTNGKLDVIEGGVYTNEKVYPTSDDGLKLAYITVYKNGEKVALIEQDDENGMTRGRDILERLRRLEKRMDYQVENNSPSRVKYACEVDPIMFNNGLSSKYDTEGSYKLGLSTNEDGQTVVSNDDTLTYIWSIIKSTYKYSYEETVKTTAYCRVFNVDALASDKKGKKNKYDVSDGIYHAKLSSKDITQTNPNYTLKNGIKGETIKVEVKSGKKTKYTKKAITNSKGEATLDFNNIGLKKGTYTVYTTVGGKTIKTTFKVHNKSYTVASPGSKKAKVTLKDRVKTTVKDNLKNEGIIYGNDAFETSHMTVDTKNGIVELEKVDNSKAKYKKNKALSTKKGSKPYYNSDVYEYKVYSNKKNLKSEFPVLHLKFNKDTHIKSIKPYIKKFKNMKSFGILLFKNDQVLNIKSHKRKLVEKKIKKDPVYPNIFKKSKTLKKPKNNAKDKDDDKKDSKEKKNDGIQKLDSYVTFDTDIKLKAGTYTLVIYGKLIDGKEEGSFFLREFDTHGNLEQYGMSAKSTGSSNLSLLKMSTSNLTSRSWNVVFEQKTDGYYEKGTIMSTPKTSGELIKSCKIKKNIEIPPNSGCSAKLQVSNDGGSSWVDATNTNKVYFNSYNNVFRWKLTFEGTGEYTPKLYYKPKKKYAIKFTLNTKSERTEFEDFGRCYETPLLNANSITRTFVSDKQVGHRFSEWEFARLFMLDEDDGSNVDICISYDDDNNDTSVGTYKDNWGSKIFFSTIFADLKLSDFNTNSVDYDNYEGDIEFDEHNFPFKMESEAIIHNNSLINIAAPSSENTDYYYGNINNESIRDTMNTLFQYIDVHKITQSDGTEKTLEYQYVMREEDEKNKYGGAILTEGPHCSAVFVASDATTQLDSFDKYDDDNKNKYVINGVSFNNALKLDETKSTLTLEIYPAKNLTVSNKELTETTSTDTRTSIEGGTFSVVVSLATDGTIGDDSSTGKAYTINKDLIFGQYNTFGIDLSQDIEQYGASGIRSIGIIANKPENIKKGDGIGLGLIGVSAYNRRPYTPYMYTGDWKRMQWQKLNSKARVFNLIQGESTDGTWLRYFYPTGNLTTSNANQTVTPTDYEDFGYAHKYVKSAIRLEKGPGYNNDNPSNNTKYKRKINTISRKGNDITMSYTYNDGNPNNTATHKIHTTTQGDIVVLDFPAGELGDIFKIDVNIPFTIYDLINIEYYIYHRAIISTKTKEDRKNTDNTPTYALDKESSNASYSNLYDYYYEGSFSKGDIKFKFYTDSDTTKAPVETFVLPSWGLVQQNATVADKTVSAWFKKRSDAPRIKTIVVERANPTGKAVNNLKLVLNNILLYNADNMPALGPQMQMRIYPKDDLSEIQIRKVGCIYRL